MNEVDEATLLKLAEAEILGEAKRSIVRHSVAGPSGWKPIPKTNKSFLVNTLLQTLSSNRILSKKHGSGKDAKKSDRKLLQIDRKQMTSINFVFEKSGDKKQNKQTKCKRKAKKTQECKVKKEIKN